MRGKRSIKHLHNVSFTGTKTPTLYVTLLMSRGAIHRECKWLREEERREEGAV